MHLHISRISLLYPLGFGKNEKRSLRRKCLEHNFFKRGLLMYSRLSTSDTKKRRNTAKKVTRRE